MFRCNTSLLTHERTYTIHSVKIQTRTGSSFAISIIISSATSITLWVEVYAMPIQFPLYPKHLPSFDEVAHSNPNWELIDKTYQRKIIRMRVDHFIEWCQMSWVKWKLNGHSICLNSCKVVEVALKIIFDIPKLACSEFEILLSELYICTPLC